ncbi:predicted protein [Naegleria gruberi]|uniref:Predicted protein n=1 Tax=Naegleria gruberi TaxID=5762 RepID=D2V153_NAEGR|nr:uncharacterized protein NAEGRDRAFT_30147 [Naegleria gruberi]EFC49634.1 predicted protein [Naegleria gruberi]|eukprot:XP_002682378.1 predicted protein [Naegleria gruberi strain NEG-M]
MGATEHTSHHRDPLPNHDSNDYTYQHSSGYILVNSTYQKHYWYYFQQAATNPIERPLILFLNGGPGCSSMEYFGSGIGNVNVSTDGKLAMEDNYYSWNRFANVIYLDAPAGVGYSYANDTSVYKVNSDAQTAAETRSFLIEFLNHYSKFRNNEVYISGASYGGKYVPALAKLILEENLKGEFVINLKGITLGNPLIHWQQSFISSSNYYASVGMISKELLVEAASICGWNDPDNWLVTHSGNQECTDKCMTIYTQAHSGINIFNLFKDTCNNNNLNSLACYGEHLKKYMNLESVQSFFKLRSKVDWDACYPRNGFEYGKDEFVNGLPALQYLLDRKNFKTLIYTGDMDGSTPVVGFYDVFAKANGLTVQANLTTWSVDYQVAGRKTVYSNGLTYATVRGAGHIAPLDQPARVYALVSNFIQNGVIPDSILLPELPEPDQINTPEVIALKTLSVLFIFLTIILTIVVIVLAVCLGRQCSKVRKAGDFLKSSQILLVSDTNKELL